MMFGHGREPGNHESLRPKRAWQGLPQVLRIRGPAVEQQTELLSNIQKAASHNRRAMGAISCC